MTYQLVLQFPGLAPTDYDTMIDVEDALIEHLDGLADVDGHDIGSGEFNIFIRCDEGNGVFEIVMRVPDMQPFLDRLWAAYRSEEGEIFTSVYPPGLGDFSVA